MKYFIITFILCLAVLFSACEENGIDFYDEHPAIYFQLFEHVGMMELDSVAYSFAVNTKNVDTVNINVKIIGTAVDYDRSFKVQVVENQTTAHADLHYEALKSEYILPAGQINAHVPVIIYNKDPLLNDSTLKVTLEMLPSEDFTLGYKDKLQAKVLFSDRLEQPASWNILQYFFGEYNETKHRVFIELYGINFPDDANEVKKNHLLWRTYGSYLNGYFVEHYPVYDENSVIVEPWQ